MFTYWTFCPQLFSVKARPSVSLADLCWLDWARLSGPPRHSMENVPPFACPSVQLTCLLTFCTFSCGPLSHRFRLFKFYYLSFKHFPSTLASVVGQLLAPFLSRSLSLFSRTFSRSFICYLGSFLGPPFSPSIARQAPKR